MNNTFNFLFGFLAYLALAASQVYAHPILPVMASATLGKRSLVGTDPVHFMIGFGTGAVFMLVLGGIVWCLIRRAKKG
jgi:hypothetical protein